MSIEYESEESASDVILDFEEDAGDVWETFAEAGVVGQVG